MKKIIKLAEDIQNIFEGFYLAGGTSLMIKYNHRKSVDLDFFKEKLFSSNHLIKKTQRNFKVSKWEKGIDNIDFFIHGIKISFVFFPFKNIKRTERIKNISMVSDLDNFLNKIYAAGRRIEKKDPFDAAYLYKMHNWNKQIIKKSFEKKFDGQSYEIYLGALLNFPDYEPLEKWIKDTLNSLK